MYASFPWQRHVTLLPVLSFCWITPVFWISPQSLPPQDPQLQLLYLLSLSMRLCSWLKANSVRGLNSILLFQNSYYQSCNFFPSLHFPNKVCMSTESVTLHTHRSHTFSGTVHYGEEPCGEYGLSLTQLCRRFTRVMVTRLFIKFHCEIYLTYFLESVLQPTGSWRVGRDWATELNWLTWVCTTGFNRCKAYGNVTQYNEISP